MQNEKNKENEHSHKNIVTGESRNVILRIRELTKRFAKLTAVNEVNLDIYEGEILGIIGPNGSGKTTLFNLISGALKPDKGKVITKDGTNIIGKRPDEIVRKYGISRTFQIVRPFKTLEALENVTVPHIPRQPISKPSSLRGAAIKSLLEVDLGEKKNYPAAILPHGDLKRLDFARSIATSPNILLLDEPFSGLSSEDAFRVTQIIKTANKERGITLLIVEHKLRLLSKLVNRIVVLDRGRVIAKGYPKDIAENKEVIRSYLGEEAGDIVEN